MSNKATKAELASKLNRQPKKPVPASPAQVPPAAAFVKTDTPDDPEEKEKEKSKKPSINDKAVRLTVDIPENIHVKLRMKAVENRQTIKEIVLTAVKKDLGI